MANRIDLSNILINFLKKARYERHIEEGTLEENQFYAVTDGNEKTEYGDLFGNIENQADLYNALYASRLFKMEMCNDVRGYELVHKLYDRREFDLSKFTVVGNPTITEDGWITKTGYNGINQSISIPLSSEIVVRQTFKMLEHTSGFEYFDCFTFANDSDTGFVRMIKEPTKFSDECKKTDGSLTYDSFSSISVSANDIVNIKTTFKNGSIIRETSNLTTGQSDTKVRDDLIANATKLILISNYIYYGNYGYVSQDLKSFSITVDGTEVFNGIKDFKRYDTYTLPSSEVITIPYILSVDGVKIVDVAYKPLVDQLYTETGMGNYIIIDETNKTFRLPLPDIYSQIEKKTSFTLRKWED